MSYQRTIQGDKQLYSQKYWYIREPSQSTSDWKICVNIGRVTALLIMVIWVYLIGARRIAVSRRMTYQMIPD